MINVSYRIWMCYQLPTATSIQMVSAPEEPLHGKTNEKAPESQSERFWGISMSPFVKLLGRAHWN